MQNISNNTYDVIVVGGGHAGTEAALATARMGLRTLLLTHNLDNLGAMSCNPSIGGIGKSHLVKEIDALGGVMARAADASAIQVRMLNASKGPAVHATRAQVDRILYKQAIRNFLEHQPNLQLLQQTADDILIEKNKVKGIITHLGLKFYAPAIILTVGTFLDGKIHVGLNSYQGGRAGDPSALVLAKSLRNLPLRVGRLKTGTPPRIAGNTIDYSKMLEQKGDEPTPIFSYLGNDIYQQQQLKSRQVACYVAHTNEKTHEIIRKNLDKSPLYAGIIEGTGPRYCPSIEDKIVRFADKSSHQVFLEPEGLTTTEIYPNGISTSLPFEVQLEFVRSMEGCENAQIVRPGYAIEYDFFDARDLKLSLETKNIAGLFLAGQINGTTGYEEAAAQGLLAGINAALSVKNQEPWWPRRDESYIGVMVDDLVTKGTQEPYRMFTSRAEYRLLLREDNADLRLTEIGRKLGLVDDERWSFFSDKLEAIAREKKRLANILIHPKSELGISAAKILQTTFGREYHALDLLRRHEISYRELMQIPGVGPCPESIEVIRQIDIQMKYDGYIKQQLTEIERQRRHEETVLPQKINYDLVPGLSHEVRQKLNAIRPATIGQASRISGVTPAAISILLVYLKR